MKKFTKIIGVLVCLLVATVALSGFGASAAPAKYNSAYFGCFDSEFQAGSKVEVPVMLSSCEGENQTFELKVVDNYTGKTVLKHSENFPAEVGVTEYNYTLDTNGWKAGSYEIIVSNMMDSSRLSTDYAYFHLYDGVYERVNTHNWTTTVVNDLSNPHTLTDALQIPYGNGYINFYVSTVRYGEKAEEFANMGNYYDDYLYAPEGKEWVAFEVNFNNYNDSGKAINVKDFISSNALVDKNGEAIKVYSYGNIDDSYYADKCWQGTVGVGNTNTFCFPALIDSSVGIPYLRVNTLDGKAYIDLNPVKEVNTLIEDANNGVWHVYTNGVKNERFYGIVEFGSKLWYASSGVVNFDFTGTTYYDDAEYYIKNGAVDTTFTGFYSNGDYEDDSYFVNGIDDGSFKGIVEKDGAFIYVNYGYICKWYTNIAPWDGTWWYVQDGIINYEYEGIVYSDYGRCYVKDGKVDTAFNGFVFDEDYDDWMYVNNGFVDFDYQGLVYASGDFYYVSNGRWQQHGNAMAEYDGTWYAITDGRPDFDLTGIRSYYHEDIGERKNYYFENGQINWSATGLRYVDEDPTDDYDGTWYYLNNGVVDYDYEGLVYLDGAYYYVENGIWSKNIDTMTEYGGTWYAVTNGCPDYGFSGIRWYYHEDIEESRAYYFNNGSIDWTANGLYWHNYPTESSRDTDGEWVYIINGVLQNEYTGLVNLAGTWWYVEDGWLSHGETLANFGNTWYYVNDGTIDWNCNTLVKYNYVWYYAKNGTVDFACDTLVEYGNSWYYVNSGTVNWGYTGLYNYANKWFYVQDGSINWNSNTLVEYNNSWYYAKNGQVDWEAETIVYYNGVWYYVNNGVVDFECDTLVQFNDSWYYVKNGQVDWEAETIVNYGGTWFYINNGVVDFECDTLVEYNNSWYYVKGGRIDWNANKTVNYNGYDYNVVNGVVVF